MVKSRPNFPIKPFECLEAAREWVLGFVAWCNTEHLHSFINFLTPSERHDARGKRSWRKATASTRQPVPATQNAG
ncbi:MAG: hypothetical protein JKY61_12750 [Planctomycetes bacterium]|nr:hypothetical protein [Planctomycetota bacterium]